RGKRMSRADLESRTWISREQGSATSSIADDALARLGIAPKRRLALPSWKAIKLAGRHGYGLVPCTKLAVAETLDKHTLTVLPFSGWKVRRTFSIIRIRDAELTPATRLFLSTLRAHWRASLSRPNPPSPRKRRQRGRPSFHNSRR